MMGSPIGEDSWMINENLWTQYTIHNSNNKNELGKPVIFRVGRMLNPSAGE